MCYNTLLIEKDGWVLHWIESDGQVEAVSDDPESMSLTLRVYYNVFICHLRWTVMLFKTEYILDHNNLSRVDWKEVWTVKAWTN
jgi:hypothetical protein